MYSTDGLKIEFLLHLCIFNCILCSINISNACATHVYAKVCVLYRLKERWKTRLYATRALPSRKRPFGLLTLKIIKKNQVKSIFRYKKVGVAVDFVSFSVFSTNLIVEKSTNTEVMHSKSHFPCRYFFFEDKKKPFSFAVLHYLFIKCVHVDI